MTMIMLLSERRSASAARLTAACKSSGSLRLICFMGPVSCYHGPMSRYRLYPSAEQEHVFLGHCAHARYVWNLAVEQQSWWTLRRGPAPAFAAHCRQLTEARREFAWLAAGSVNVQQQALRDFAQAIRNFFGGTHRRPTWRKAGRDEGFRITDTCRTVRLNRRWGQVWVPKAGWVRFRWSRPVPDAKSFRVTRDRAGRWHVAFAAIPQPVPGPGTGEVVGIDRGVAVTLALSDGTTYQAPAPSRRTERLQRCLSRAKRGSRRKARARDRLARAAAREADTRKDWAEKTSTGIARRYDLIRIEDLRIANMTRSARGTLENPGRNVRQKAGLNRAILASGWGIFAQRLEHKAAGRVEKVNPAYTSQTCSACGITDREARESQAVFRCRSCGNTLNADVNAARNIAAGRAVTARGGSGLPEPVNREPLTGAA
jgi:putative transposase